MNLNNSLPDLIRRADYIALISILFKQGFKQGARERALKDILEVLELRLKPYAVTAFKPTLETIEDLDRLAQLHRAAILAETLDDFAQVLTESSD